MGFPYPTPASLHQQHQSLLQNHHHQQLLPPLSHLPAPFLPHNNGNNNFNPVQQPPNLGLPVESHFPAYFPRNGNGQQQQQILDQQQQQQQQQSQPHFPHQLHQQQHQHQSYVPPPDPFLPYHHSNNDHNSHSGRSYTLPFPQTHQHQHQHDQIPRLSAPIYANYGQQQQQQSNSNQNGRVESNSRPATATSSHSHSHSHFQSQPQPPRPSTATSTSTTTKGKRRASDAALDERAEEEEDEYEEYEDYEEGEQSGDENEQEEEEDVKPDLGRLLQQQQQQQQEQQVFQVRGGGIVMMQQNDPENGARIWEQHEQEGMREGGMTATTTARPSTATACSRPSSSSASSMMISTPPLPSPHNQQLLPASTTTTNANASQILTLPKAPNAEYPRQIWWDFLLSQFGRNREGAYAMVVSQLSNLFKISNHWLAFINIPLFVAKLHHPVHRQNLQPALVYSMLALSSHMSSWDGPGGNGFEGRLLGLQFKEQALTAFWNSWNSGWIDAGLAKAAFLMALYEASAHPLQSDQRSASAMLLLDNVLRTLALPALDVNDPNANMFPKGQIPEITSALMGSGVAPLVAYSSLGLHSEQSTTNCPFWTACPRWSNPHDPTSVQEIEKDESRRLVWSASALAASFSMFRFSVGLDPVDLYVGNPENFALLYPGENLFVGSGQDGKSSIWALYATTAMLWHFALRHHLSDSSEEEKRNQAVKVWTVSRSLEAMFDQAKKRVTGDTEMEWYERIASLAYDWQSRDWLLTSRMLVSDSFSRFIPDASSHEIINDFHVASARHWLYTQSGVAKYLNPVNQSQVSSDARALINHRPVWIFWFMQQLTRALHLYELNPEFTEALTVVREDLAPMLQFLLNLYPSEGLFDSLTVIISRLNEANRQASFPEVVLHFPAVLNREEVRSLMARQPLGDSETSV
ncbi:hypothetical protein BDY24DRAFT_403485 [Mrakia frigida]|uniref:uncharacterized protein n=1 Tax=Mrakia frigida TaxID=29902 RepID=UPI003FCBF6EA